MDEGGLTEISIHVDITQRGRGHGYHAPEVRAGADAAARRVRGHDPRGAAATGRPLRAATTLTVTGDNLPQMPADVVRWLIRNRDAFSLVSFQPLAQVGRTRKRLSGVSAAELWREIGKATADFGLELPGAGAHAFRPPRMHALRAAPRDRAAGRGARTCCSSSATSPRTWRVMQELFDRGLGGIAFRDDLPVESAGARRRGDPRRAGLVLGSGAPLGGRASARARRGPASARLLLDALRGKARVDGFTLTSHHFMSPEELATEVGQARLEACVFRLPYKGEMVPMCRMNAAGVRELYAGCLAGPGNNPPAGQDTGPRPEARRRREARAAAAPQARVRLAAGQEVAAPRRIPGWRRATGASPLAVGSSGGGHSYSEPAHLTCSFHLQPIHIAPSSPESRC